MKTKINREHQASTYLRDGRAPVPNDKITSIVMSANKASGTKPEIAFRKELRKTGLRGYRVNFKTFVGRPDIVFTRVKLAIFVHGCFWHRCPHCALDLPKSNREFWQNKFEANVSRDVRKVEELRRMGWKVFTIWECEVKSSTKRVKAVAMIKRAYELRRS